MSVYTGVTIGPIVATMQYTSKPAGLWGASALFSWITKTLLEQLAEQGLADAIVSPAVSFVEETKDGVKKKKVRLSADCEAQRQVGVGLFHDRIILEGDRLGEVQTTIAGVIGELAKKLTPPGDGEDKTNALTAWLQSYLRIYALKKDVEGEKSPLLTLGPLLSAMELEPSFPVSEENNPLLAMLSNVSVDEDPQRGGANAAVKNSFLVKELQNVWMLLDESGKPPHIRDIPDIASGGRAKDDHKARYYYAILNSDGDGMSKVLEKLTDKNDIKKYSDRCMAFCAKAAELIRQYRGVPIYAGGDDLLAILPVFGRGGNETNLTIFGLIEQLREAFNEVFAEERSKLRGVPTISFGVSIRFERSPLYEALEKARELLELAKYGVPESPKNALRLELSKHSGQNSLLALELLDAAPSLLAELDKLFGAISPGGKDAVEHLKSAGYKLEAFEKLFRIALSLPAAEAKERVAQLIENLFDNEGQQKYEPFLDRLKDYASLLLDSQAAFSEKIEAGRKKTASENGLPYAPPAQEALTEAQAGQVFARLTASLRILHFLLEQKEAK